MKNLKVIIAIGSLLLSVIGGKAMVSLQWSTSAYVEPNYPDQGYVSSGHEYSISYAAYDWQSYSVPGYVYLYRNGAYIGSNEYSGGPIISVEYSGVEEGAQTVEYAGHYSQDTWPSYFYLHVAE